eukprot:gene9430-6616_t
MQPTEKSGGTFSFHLPLFIYLNIYIAVIFPLSVLHSLASHLLRHEMLQLSLIAYSSTAHTHTVALHHTLLRPPTQNLYYLLLLTASSSLINSSYLILPSLITLACRSHHN